MEVTTLALAVDSTQVNSASAALQKMAAEGFKAESVVAKLANSAQVQGRALNAGIVRNANAAADSIKGLTGATSALANTRDFSQTTSGLAAAAAQANTATAAVRAFGAAIASSAAAGASLDFTAPRSSTVQQIAQTPVSVLARSRAANGAAPAVAADIDSKPINTAANALDKYADQAAKAKAAAEGLTSAAQEQGRTLGAGIATGAAAAATGLLGTASAMNEAAVKANAAAAAFANANTAAARVGNDTKQFNAFSGLGVASAAAIPTAAPAQTSAFSAAAANATKQVTALGQANKMTADQARQLSFQMNDFFVQVASGQSALTAAIQQGSQLAGTFNGIGGAARAVMSLITPLSVGLAGAAAAIGTLGYAFLEGQKQSKEFANALVLSGNFAGQTEGQYNAMAKRIAESGQVTISSTREVAKALISTGQIGPETLGMATEAAVKYAAATGKTAEEVAADFAKMTQGPSEFAKQLNRSMNQITAPQYALMKSFEDGGKAVDAQAVFYQTLITRLNDLEPNLTGLDRILREGKLSWDKFWDSALGGNRTQTVEDKLASVSAKIAAAQRSANDAPSIGAYGGPRPSGQSTLNTLLAEQAALKEQQKSEAAAAADRAKKAAAAKAGIAATDYKEKALKAAKPDSARQSELDENARQAKAAAAAGTPYTKEEIAQLDAATRKKFAGPKGPVNNEASQILREQLADDLSAFKIALDREKEALAFHQREMQGVYQAGGISLKAFFDDKRATIADGVTAETAQLDKEIARLKQYQAAIKDPSEKIRVGKQIGQVEAQKADVKTNGERALVLANQEAQASFKALDDQIDNYRANLLQMSGDELGAARIRASIAEGNASVLATQSGGRISQADIDRQTALTEAANQFAEAQRQAGNLAQNTARAEEAAYMAAELGGKSLAEQENAIYAVRSRSLDQLGLLATKARELAEASTDPKIKQFAADLALQYAKAAEAVDPALNRLREAQRNLAAGITNSIDSGVATFGPAYIDQRKTARDEIKDERDKYDRKIEILEGYLATTRDKNDQARLREKIKNLEAQKDSVKGESKTSSFLKTVDKQFVQPIAGQALATVNKLLITDPLNEYLKGQFKSLSEGEGLFAGFFKNAMGIKDAKVDPKILAEQAAATATDTLANSLTAQTSAVQSSTLALEALANAANSAAGNSNSRPLTVEAGSRQAAPSLGDFTRADRALEASQSASADPAATAAGDVAKVLDQKAMPSVSNFCTTLDQSNGSLMTLTNVLAGANRSLSFLPSIIQLIQMTATTGGKGGGGGLFGSIAGLFGSGSASGMATNSAGMAAGQGVSAEALANLMQYGLAEGGLVKGPGTGKSDSIPARLSNGEFVMPAEKTKAFLPILEEMRSGSAFANAPRYHTGGIVGQKADGARSALAAAALKAGEVPAILMRNEEVLRRDDPRHRENLGSDVFAKVMQSKGENSASVLQGLLTRLGVKDDEPAVSGALKVAGARELGGPVSAGKLYRVNERRPELLNVGNKQYLMMGAQGGSVDPNPQQGKGGQPFNQTINFMSSGPVNHQTQQQLAAVAYRAGVRASSRNN